MSDMEGYAKVAKRLIVDALVAGYTLSVYDGEEFALKRSSNAGAILAALFSTDADTLVYRPKGQVEGSATGSVYLVYGNLASELICDCSTSLEDLGLLKGAEAAQTALEALGR